MWRKKLYQFAESFIHPAWGFSHFERVYNMCVAICKAENIEYDDDIIYAAAYIHDIGAFDPYKEKNIDHSETSALICDKILLKNGFPPEKINYVKSVVRGHMYYSEMPDYPYALAFRDADTLDFMGVIGITRMVALTGKDDSTPDLQSSIKLIRKHHDELLDKLIFGYSKSIGQKRKDEMEAYLKLIFEETNGLKYV